MVLASRLVKGWEIRDRQQQRAGRQGQLPKHDCELMAWTVDPDSSGVKSLKKELGVAELAKTHAAYLA